MKKEKRETVAYAMNYSTLARVKRATLPYGFRYIFFFSSRRRHTRFDCDWSSDVCSSDLWTHHSHSVQLIHAAGMLQLLLGNIGRAGGGLNALRGHANIQGGKIGRASCRERV